MSVASIGSIPIIWPRFGGIRGNSSRQRNQWNGLRDLLQENTPYLMGTSMVSRFDFPFKPVH